MASVIVNMTQYRESAPDPASAAASPTAILRRQVLVQAVLLLGTALLIIAVLLVIAAIRENRIVLENQTRTVTSLLDDLRSRLAATILDYSHWNDAVAHLTPETDPVWADANIGPYLHETFGYAVTGVLSPDDRITYAALDQSRGGEGLVAEAVGRLAPQIAAVRAAALEERAVRTEFLRIDDAVYLFGVAAVTPEDASGEAAESSRSVLLLGRRLDAGLLDDWGARFVLSRIRLLDHSSGPVEFPLIALAGAEGRAAGAITWEPARPGDELLVGLLPALVALAAVLGYLGWRIATAWQKALGLVRTTERELSAIVEAAPDGIALIDPSGHVRRLNPAAERIFGRTGPKCRWNCRSTRSTVRMATCSSP